MRVETTIAVPKAVVRNQEVHGRLVTEARTRLVELGQATQGGLAREPVMHVSDGDIGSGWVDVTFSWDRD
ncbi:MAG TPA: hypothetical protein VGN48_16715 [Pedococcus sp.]|jgi:hypothetical protein|nr:hypothetical protein [Pedococcus sp.]